MSRFIQIVEVGPRDGLQNEKLSLSVDEKLDLIRKLEAAGARRTEVVSFVNPNRVPQMAGAEEIMAALIPDQRTPDLDHSRIGLVLNMRGWERCVSAGCDEANVVVCATDGFGLANQGATAAQQVDALAAIVERQAVEGGPPITATISVAFGCPFDGEVSEDQVVAIARDAASMGVAEIAIADTIGVADPWTVRRRIEAVRAAAPDVRLRLHFHDTRNTGLANAYAGVEAGVDVLDASVGGLGGCPFAPNATGNIGTEDLVYMLERAGFETTYDLAQLIELGNWASSLVGKSPAASVSRAGGFPSQAQEVA